MRLDGSVLLLARFTRVTLVVARPSGTSEPNLGS